MPFGIDILEDEIQAWGHHILDNLQNNEGA